ARKNGLSVLPVKRRVAFVANWLQVVGGVGAAFSQRNDVVRLRCKTNSALPPAPPAKRVGLQHPGPSLLILPGVSPGPGGNLYRPRRRRSSSRCWCSSQYPLRFGVCRFGHPGTRQGGKGSVGTVTAPFAPRVTCEYAFVKRSYLTATLATCSLSAAAPSSSFRRPQSGSIPTKSASCSYHALSRKARASAAQYGFPDARSR